MSFPVFFVFLFNILSLIFFQLQQEVESRRRSQVQSWAWPLAVSRVSLMCWCAWRGVREGWGADRLLTRPGAPPTPCWSRVTWGAGSRRWLRRESIGSAGELHFLSVFSCSLVEDDLYVLSDWPLQAGPAGSSCTALRGRRPGAPTTSYDVITKVHLHWPGWGPAPWGVAGSGVSGQTGPGRWENQYMHQVLKYSLDVLTFQLSDNFIYFSV